MPGISTPPSKPAISGSPMPAIDWKAQLGPLGFGGTAIGNLFAAVSEEEAQATVEAALAQGIRYFDTAPYYGYGLSEERTGRYLAGRSDVQISTKVGRVIEETPPDVIHNEGYVVPPGRGARFDYSRDGVMRSIEASLKRLQRGRVDILYLHDVGQMTHGDLHPEMLALALNETLPAMAELKAAGVCDAIGIGVNEEAICLEIMPQFDLDLILLAGRYTLLEQATLSGVMAEAHKRGTGIVVGGPYNSGILAPRDKPGDAYDYAPAGGEIRAQAEAIYACAARHGVDPGAAALQFPLAHSAVVSVIAGMRSVDEVAQACARAKAEIALAFWNDMRETGLLQEGTPTP